MHCTQTDQNKISTEWFVQNEDINKGLKIDHECQRSSDLLKNIQLDYISIPTYKLNNY